MKKEKVKIIRRYDTSSDMEELSIEYNGNKKYFGCGNYWDTHFEEAMPTIQMVLEFIGHDVEIVHKKYKYK